MKTVHVVAVVAGAMAIEAVTAYAIWPKAAEEAPREESRQERRHRVRDVQETEDTRALHRRIRELERRLQEANAEAPKQEEKIAEGGDGGNRRGEDRGGFSMRDIRERMERFEKEDPERFAQMTNGVAQGMRRMQARQQARAEFLASIDTSKMTDAQKDIHARYQEFSARQQELQEYMRPDANVTDEERQAALDEMREVGRTVRELAHQERDVLLAQAAQNMGYSAEDAESVVAQIKDIYQVTDNWGMGGPGGPGGGRGWGGNGGGRGGWGGGGRGNGGGRGGRGR